MKVFANPFKPGAGHPPPYLAGREGEQKEFRRLLQQDTILENLVLTGLRGVGKTVLLDTFRPLALEAGWLWVGADASEAVTVSEEALAIRLMVDVSALTSNIQLPAGTYRPVGFQTKEEVLLAPLNFGTLRTFYDQTPGLVADKLKAVLELAWNALCQGKSDAPAVVFAYDEAQNLSDQAAKEQYPLSLLLDVFQSLQRKGIRFMLLLAGLPTLFAKLVESRTYAERMFRVVFLQKLSESASREAITRPITKAHSPVSLDDTSVALIVQTSGGYPYFIQFICREAFDAFLFNVQHHAAPGAVPIDSIVRKLDSDFFAGRWARVTDRQRDLLRLIAKLDGADDEFTVQDVVELSRTEQPKPFGSSHVNQMLSTLAENGLVYKNRHGKYSFAVPLFGEFVLRQMRE
jgi:AAA ATPase domain